MPSEKPKIRKIQCPKCGASLSLYGGDQVVSLICSHCRSSLDAEHGFKVLKTYQSLKRPNVPLKIGGVGTLKGVSFTIIGMVEFTQKDQWGTYPWVEFLLYSPTHGYTWLCYEDGHYVFGREVKDVATAQLKDLLGTPLFNTTLSVKGKTLRVYECASAEVSYVEGELTWVAQLGDKIDYLDAVAPPFLYSVEETRFEREYFYGEYATPEEIFQGFDLTGRPKKPVGAFSCQPYPGSPILTGMSRAAKYCAGLGLFLVLFSFFSGKTIAEGGLQLEPDKTAEYSFEVTRPRTLHQLQLTTDLDNAWADFEVGIRKDQGQVILGWSHTISYFHGVDDEGAWSEGSRKGRVSFKVPEEGSYVVTVSAKRGTDETSGGTSNQPISLLIAIEQGVHVPHYYLLLFLSMAGVSFFPSLRQKRFERTRWQDYYESLEEEDEEGE